MAKARIHWISGPVLRARAEGPFALREAVRIGPQALLGEVVRLAGDDVIVQVYEDTTGLRPGADVALAVDVASSHFFDRGQYHLTATPFGSWPTGISPMR